LLELVLLFCAQQDPSSLAVAASAHSKLHQAAFTSETAAVLTAHSIKPVLHEQQKMDQVLAYLHKYGQHIESLDLTGTRSREEPGWIRFNAFLQQLPNNNLQKLRSLSFSNMRLQLLPGDGFHGVLGVGTALTQLQINSCKVMEGMNDLAEALLLLPDLQHLSITQTYVGGTERRFPLPIVAIGTLQKLTHLVLAGDPLQDADGHSHLQGLTNLQHVKLTGLQAAIRVTTLFPFEHLTHLEVAPSSNPDQATGSCRSGVFEPAALAGMTQLQHVQLSNSSIVGGPAGVAELLSHLQQHLTHVKTFIVDKPAPVSLKSCVTLTASIQLQTVIISGKLSSQQVLGIAKQFPHLRALEVNICCSGRAPSLHTSGLVGCCPGLQALVTPGFHYSAEVVAQLSEMSSLTKLSLRPDSNAWDTVCQMTGLRHLRVSIPDGRKREELQLLRQLTQLQQLTCLDFRGGDASCCLTSVSFHVQLLRLCVAATFSYYVSYPSRMRSGHDHQASAADVRQICVENKQRMFGPAHQQYVASFTLFMLMMSTSVVALQQRTLFVAIPCSTTICQCTSVFHVLS
jgi:hypothetical protein